MKPIHAVLEVASDGTFDVFCETDPLFCGVGDTAEQAKVDMIEQMKFFKETAIKEGFEYPSFLDGEFQIEYKTDKKS